MSASECVGGGGERERETVQLAEDSMPSKVHFNMYVWGEGGDTVQPAKDSMHSKHVAC